MRNTYRILTQAFVAAALAVSGLSAATANDTGTVIHFNGSVSRSNSAPDVLADQPVNTGSTDPGTVGMVLGGLGLLAIGAFKRRFRRRDGGHVNASSGEDLYGTSLNAMWDQSSHN